MLNQTTLKLGLIKAFTAGGGKTTADAAGQAADALLGYAQFHAFGGSKATGLDAKRGALVSIFTQAYGSMSIIANVNAWKTAIETLWVGLPVAGASGTGTIPAVPGATALVAALPALFVAGYGKTTEQFAQSLAAAVHTATSTIIVPLTVPGTPPVVTPTPIA